ncbi:hypothetical protein A3D00_05475 [Candidatus Woesebacteria bacterium RIFCSPHIGHO2_02_FULL_38_9]|uniref:Uncharacterized protein n=1 Tax=Candidatus Woesebacteria bacterium RIFCSPHIGHO2_01_FULL_39_28 TaxID=1802496 RepID=A0A1F7YL64_9BACT|nr:MAG: hypothetical protein A2627_00630 [Candidatus Woesebacteria bacterium RIFCSPHIGHO2_01_FULL_39_28]OGM33319.1 MAG: hypothetical protein A3D00_05475 [Candidatus Woesebacteria bacterium RIFCSPHIGHO2_02_FULL_38_9]OGM56683.1 MAG: hypothetical protein A3A50_04990 [Candidatus Woesebacteria bacterium RIFCSPLOWO2_01_FULL_38_20]
MDRLAQIQNFSLNAPNQFANLTSITFPNLLRAVITGVMVIAAIVFFFMLIIGGIKWITSGGDKTQTEAARNQITAALIGLVVVFSAWAIVTLINTFFNVDLFNLTLPNASGV